MLILIKYSRFTDRCSSHTR